MARFRYKAVTSAGEVVHGTAEAATRQAAVERLREQGHTPIRVEAAQVGAGLRLLAGGGRRSRRLAPDALVLLTRELATLLRAGLPLDRALAILGEIAEGPARRAFVSGVLDAVRGGSSLADALAAQQAALPPYYVGLVRAGEAGGTLDEVLARLADALERAQALRESVRSAMYYPVFVLVMSFLTLVLLFTVVVPQFRPLFRENGATMPLPMAVVMAVSDGLQSYGWVLLLAALLLAVALRLQALQPAARLRRDRRLLRLPVIGTLIAKIEVARFARTLGTLLANGVVLLSALSITAGTIGNRCLADAVEGVAARLKRGEGLATPLMETGLFPRLALQLIHVGEESGQLETMLIRVADIYDEEVKRGLQRLLALLVPAVTIFLGLLVAAIIGSMLMAILSTYELPQ
jgi:general secretion pathway protein F